MHELTEMTMIGSVVVGCFLTHRPALEDVSVLR
jgi:hypothetical protein